MKVLTVFLAIAIISIGCGEDDASPNNSSSNNLNNSESNNSTANNEENNLNVQNNNTSNNSDSNNSNNVSNSNIQNPDEPYISAFQWIFRDGDCTFVNCDLGWQISTVSKTIRNADGRVANIGDDDDWQAWEEVALTDEVIEKMRNGWDCPEPSGESERTYRIEARIFEDGAQLEIQDVTGCVESGDETLAAIEAEIDNLVRLYLP